MSRIRTIPLGARSRLYSNLARCLDSGLSLLSALELVEEAPTRESLAQLRKNLKLGMEWGEALQNSPVLPAEERRTLAAAAVPGRLQEALQSLAKDLEELAARRRDLLQRVMYPALVLHLVPPALSTSLLVTDPSAFVVRVLSAWMALWVLAAVLFGLHRHFRTRLPYLQFLARIPLIGAPLRTRSLLQFSRTLGWQYGAGVDFAAAAADAAETTGLLLRAEFLRTAQRARQGDSMAEALSELKSLDPLLRSELTTAAEVGDLERALERTVRTLGSRETAQLQLLARTAARGLYLLAMLSVAGAVLYFYSERLSVLGNLMEGR